MEQADRVGVKNGNMVALVQNGIKRMEFTASCIMNHDELVKSPENRLCERSEAISQFVTD